MPDVQLPLVRRTPVVVRGGDCRPGTEITCQTARRGAAAPCCLTTAPTSPAGPKTASMTTSCTTGLLSSPPWWRTSSWSVTGLTWGPSSTSHTCSVDGESVDWKVNVCVSGLLLGAYVIGWFSDRKGRVPALSLGVLLVSLSGFSAAHCYGPTGLVVFSILRFITGVGGMACFMVSFVLIVEHVSYKYSMMAGIGINIPFAVGEFVLGLESYFIRNWRLLQMVAHGPLVILIMVSDQLHVRWWTITCYRFTGFVLSL